MFRQLIGLTGARLVGAVLQALALILLARSAGVAEYGTFSTIFAVQSVLFTVAIFGMPTFILREHPLGRLGHVAAALTLNRRISVACSVVAVAATAWIGGSADFALLAVVLSASFALEKSTEVNSALRIARGETRSPAVAIVVRPLVALAAVSVAGLAGHALLVYAVGRMLGAVVGALLTRVRSPDEAIGSAALVRALWPIAIGVSVTTFATLDVALVAVFGGSAEAGLYGAASRIVAPAGIVAAAFATVVMPRVVGVARTAAAQWLRRLNSLFVALIPVALAVAAFGQPIMGLVFGAAFERGGLILAFLVLTVPFNIAGTVYETLMQAWGAERTGALLALVFTPIALAAATVGALAGAGEGAALALLVTAVVKGGTMASFALRAERRHFSSG